MSLVFVASKDYKQTSPKTFFPLSKTLNKQKEAPFRTFKSKDGSYTIEAAFCLTFMMFVLVTFMWIMHAISTQYVVKSALYNTACDFVAISDEAVKDNSKLKAAVIADGKVRLLKKKKYLKGIKGGTAAISLMKTNVTKEYITVHAEYSLKQISKLFPSDLFHIEDEVKLRRFIGWDLSMDEDSRNVYVTKNGEAYHESRDCSYLKLKIKEVKYSQISKYRAKDGRKYVRCNCVKRRKGDRVYISDYGYKAHGDMNCISLRRTIRVIEKEEAVKEGYHKCPKCGGK